MAMYNISKRITDEGTQYNIYVGLTLIHREFSFKAAGAVVLKLEQGVPLYEITEGQANARIEVIKAKHVRRMLVFKERLSVKTKKFFKMFTDVKVKELQREKDRNAELVYAINTLQKKQTPTNLATTSNLSDINKRYLTLYQRILWLSEDEGSFYCQETVAEIHKYCSIFINHGLKDHASVQRHIRATTGWGCYPKITAFNTFQSGYSDDGIYKEFYGFVCRILGITSGNGSFLVSSLQS